MEAVSRYNDIVLTIKYALRFDKNITNNQR